MTKPIMRRSSDSSFFFFYKLWWWHATKLLQKNVTEQWTFSSQLNKGQMTDQAIISFAEAMITNQQTISTRAQAQSCKECGKYKNIHDIFFFRLISVHILCVAPCLVFTSIWDLAFANMQQNETLVRGQIKITKIITSTRITKRTQTIKIGNWLQTRAITFC